MRNQAGAEESAVGIPGRRAECVPGATVVCGSGWRAGRSDGSFWQYVQEEAAQEADGVECHDALLAAGGIIAPAEADALTASS